MNKLYLLFLVPVFVLAIIGITFNELLITNNQNEIQNLKTLWTLNNNQDRGLAFSFNDATFTCHDSLMDIRDNSSNLPYLVHEKMAFDEIVIGRYSNLLPADVHVISPTDSSDSGIFVMILTNVEFYEKNVNVDGFLTQIPSNICGGKIPQMPIGFTINTVCNAVNEPFIWTTLNNESVYLNGTMNTSCSEKK